MRISVTREVEIPDPYKLERYKRAPELGPRILFFSGGSALRNASRELIRYTHNSIHLITPFDSGGSSAVLRKAFGMPAVGDIRNRLMALADQSVKGNPEIFDLFVYRLPKDGKQEVLLAELVSLAEGDHPLMNRITDPMRMIIRNHFHLFLDNMPDDFDLRGASIGNLVLTAGYLSNKRQLAPVIYLFSKLVQVCGIVRPTVNKDLHLAVRLQDGQVIVGQHNITGKEVPPLSSPVAEMWLAENLDDFQSTSAEVDEKVRGYISSADLICYPVGSFYSSVVANLLPQGVGKAVAHNHCPKVFIPNTGDDPETRGISVAEQVCRLRQYLVQSGAPDDGNVLEYVVVDSSRGDYPSGLDLAKLRDTGVTVIDTRLVTDRSMPNMDAELLAGVLLSLT